MPDFQGPLSNYLCVYALYASLDSNSLYKLGYVWWNKKKWQQFYHKQCDGTTAKYRKNKKGSINSCDGCDKLRWAHHYYFHFLLMIIRTISSSYLEYHMMQNNRTSIGRKLRQIVNRRGDKFVSVVEFTNKSEITSMEVKHMGDFTKTQDSTLSTEDIAIKNRILIAVVF